MPQEAIKLAQIPEAIRWTSCALGMSDSTTNLNDNEILFAHPGAIIGDQRGIQKYNALCDEWQCFIQYPNDIDVHVPRRWNAKKEFSAVSLSMIDSRNVLVLKPDQMRLFMIDPTTHQFITYSETYGPKYSESNTKHNIDISCGDAHLLNVDGQIHFIGLYIKNHLVWNFDEKRFDIINMEGMDPKLNDGGFPVYIQNKDVILFFGGFYNDMYDSNVPEGSSDIWICRRKEASKDGNQWTWSQIKGSFESLEYGDLASPVGTLSADGRYVIMCAQFQGYETRDRIYIVDTLDLDNLKVNECTIKAPICDIGFTMFRTGNTAKTQLLIDGFARECFNEKEMEHLTIPQPHIRGIMSEYYNQEMVHWMVEQNGIHYALPLRALLSSRIENADI